MMAESQPLSAAPEGAEYLRAVLRAPVYEAAQITPLQKMEKLSSRLDNVVLVKREDRQPVHSFKLRGAYAMMAGLTEEQKSHGVITASAGNHAQGVAFSASRLGVKALIVMPTATADIKVDAVRGFGGEVYRFVIEGKVHVRHPRQRIGRGAGKRDDCHTDVFGNPRFIQYLLRFAAARNGNKYLIACGVAEKNIPAKTNIILDIMHHINAFQK